MENSIGERIRQIRLDRGLSQRNLADALGVTQPTLSNWERQSIAPKRFPLKRIADELGVDEEYFIANGSEIPAQLDALTPQALVVEDEVHDPLPAHKERHDAFREYPRLSYILSTGWRYLDPLQKALLARTTEQLYAIAQQVYDAPAVPQDYRDSTLSIVEPSIMRAERGSRSMSLNGHDGRRTSQVREDPQGELAKPAQRSYRKREPK